MRVLSAQGKQVWDILVKDKIYHANPDKCREKHDYREDIESLNGRQPIWCFAYPDINFYTMYSGEVLEYLRCEMSLRQRHCWDGFVLFELEIDRRILSTGYAHNACSYSCIFGELTLDMVKDVYTVRDSDEDGWYYKVLTPIYTSGSDVIATEELDCRKVSEYAESSTEGLSVSVVGKCLLCERDTLYTDRDKHFCCIEHKWQHYNRFTHLCRTHNIDTDSIEQQYNELTDADFSRGAVKAVKHIVSK